MEYHMKGQDIGLLLKLVCLQRHESHGKAVEAWPHDWKDWEEESDDQITRYQGQPDFFEESPHIYPPTPPVLWSYKLASARPRSTSL